MFESSQNDFPGTPQNYKISVKFSGDLVFFLSDLGPQKVENHEISQNIYWDRQNLANFDFFRIQKPKGKKANWLKIKHKFYIFGESSDNHF